MHNNHFKSALLAAAVLGAIVMASAMSFVALRYLLIKDTEVLVYTVAQSLSPAVLMNDTQQVETVLKSLRQYPGVESAELLSAEGATIASYAKDGHVFDAGAFSSFELAAASDAPHQLHVTAPITFDSLVVANLHMAVNFWPMYLRVIVGMGVLLMIPSVMYVVFKQLRIQVRFEKHKSSDDESDQGEMSFDVQQALNVALNKVEISLEYQPIHHLNDGGLYGMEVVVCWRHPSGQTLHLAPSDFVNLAKENGISLPFDDWLLEKACSQAVTWQHQFGPLVLCFAISTTQFSDPKFPSRVREICAQTQYPHQLLALDVHESLVASHGRQSLPRIEALTAEGLNVTVDRFGLQRQSLDGLSCLPVQKIKLDRRLIRHLDRDPQIEQLVNEIVTHALSVEVQVMVAAVDQASQLSMLQRMGCTLGQGSYFCAPMPAAVFEAFLAARPFDGLHASAFTHQEFSKLNQKQGPAFSA